MRERRDHITLAKCHTVQFSANTDREAGVLLTAGAL